MSMSIHVHVCASTLGCSTRTDVRVDSWRGNAGTRVRSAARASGATWHFVCAAVATLVTPGVSGTCGAAAGGGGPTWRTGGGGRGRRAGRSAAADLRDAVERLGLLGGDDLVGDGRKCHGPRSTRARVERPATGTQAARGGSATGLAGGWQGRGERCERSLALRSKARLLRAGRVLLTCAGALRRWSHARWIPDKEKGLVGGPRRVRREATSRDRRARSRPRSTGAAGGSRARSPAGRRWTSGRRDLPSGKDLERC